MPTYVESIVKEHLQTTMRCDLNMLQAKCMTQEIGNYTILCASKFQKQNGVAVSCGLKHMQAKALTNKLVTAIVELRTIFGLQIFRRPRTFAGQMLDIEHLLDCNFLWPQKLAGQKLDKTCDYMSMGQHMSKVRVRNISGPQCAVTSTCCRPNV